MDAEDEVILKYELEIGIQVLEPNKWWWGVNFERGNGGVVLALTIFHSRNSRLRIMCRFTSIPHMHARLEGQDSVRLHRDNIRCVVMVWRRGLHQEE